MDNSLTLNEISFFGSSMSNDLNKTDTTLDLPVSVSKRQIEKGKEITEEILRNPELLKEIKEGLAEIERGEVVDWREARKR